MLEGMEAFNTRLFEVERGTVERAEATGTERGTSEFDTHHRHEGDRQARLLQWRSNQIRRLVVQTQVTHGCSGLSIPATVRRSGTASRPDLERHS